MVGSDSYDICPPGIAGLRIHSGRYFTAVWPLPLHYCAYMRVNYSILSVNVRIVLILKIVIQPVLIIEGNSGM